MFNTSLGKTDITSYSIPQQIQLLKKLSKNLWWSWNHKAQNIFTELSPRLWSRYNHNPILVMNNISNDELTAILSDHVFTEKVNHVLSDFESYLSDNNTWADKNAKDFKKNPIAYFSAEFGLHECIPIYSGGLGILAGDHIKSASDLGLNFVGVTLFYREGYFNQQIANDGWQQEEYTLHNPANLPLSQILDEQGNPVTVSVELGHNVVDVAAWEINVGRARLILLDTNLDTNEGHYRDITCHVYGGDSTTRINQEIILGIGGTKMLEKLGIEPKVYHMNEGHSAFLTLELLGKELKKGKSLEKSIAKVKSHCVFTTHTPVPAGHDRFSEDLMEYSLAKYADSINLSFKDLMNLGREHKNKHDEQFTMTVLCLHMSRKSNGVSELNGEIARDMWNHIYTDGKAPIEHVTNGIHVKSWITDRTEEFWSRYTNFDLDFITDPNKMKETLNKISDAELWALRYRLKRDLIEYVRHKLEMQKSFFSSDMSVTHSDILSTDALTIGFARRFATYKRAPLIFSNIDRIAGLINQVGKPVQFIFAGKAHPKDNEGKKFIQKIISITRMPQFFGKVIFLENYDMNIARHLISGVDVWLNNPLRPLEASGTSGEKVIANCGLNFSILDGWWREGYNGENGWAIGKDENISDHEKQTELDALYLYETLENEVIPTYFKRDENNIPTEWIKKIRASLMSLLHQYNTHRMVEEYCLNYYKEQ